MRKEHEKEYERLCAENNREQAIRSQHIRSDRDRHQKEISEKNATVAVKDQEITELNNMIAFKDREISKLTVSMKCLEQKLKEGQPWRSQQLTERELALRTAHDKMAGNRGTRKRKPRG